MINIYDFFRNCLAEIISKLCAEGIIPNTLNSLDISIELIKDEKFGDYSSNVAMVRGKQLGKSPRELAEILANRLMEYQFIENANVAGPGFLNWSVKSKFFNDFLKDILESGDNYGSSNIGEGKKVNVEFVSANPTGPIHAGHARGAIVGDAIASILEKVGYKVTREYYINDYGHQIDVLASSLYGRYLEVLGVQEFDSEKYSYPGEYLKDIARDIASKDGDRWVKQDYTDYFKQYAVSSIMDSIKQDLNIIGVNHDVFISEKSLVEEGAVDKAIKFLSEKGLVYKGVLEAPKGKVMDDWEPKEQLLFKSTEFGDDVDRTLMKSDGKWTYFASDVAYHFHKVTRGFDELVDIFGADHGGYVTRMKAAVAAMNNIPFNILLTQLVKFVQNNIELKMSKRAGTFITAKDVVDSVGKDVLRFVMLTRKSEATLDFDFKKVTEHSIDNPVFYVQYASARTYSTIKQFNNIFDDFSSYDFSHISSLNITSNEERKVVKLLLDFPRQLSLAAIFKEPHRIAFFLQDLAAAFHALWNVGKCNEKLRFILENDKPVSLARCMLVRSVGIVICVGLSVLGVEAVEEL